MTLEEIDAHVVFKLPSIGLALSHPVDWQAGSEKGRLLWGREKKIKGNGQVVFMCECSLLMGKERGEQTEVESSSGLYRTAHY